MPREHGVHIWKVGKVKIISGFASLLEEEDDFLELSEMWKRADKSGCGKR